MRFVQIPAKEFYEKVRSLTEYPSSTGSPGFVRVEVSVCNEEGAFLPGPPTSYNVEGEMYTLLLGDGAGWAEEGKPLGTYRDDDLWYFIDLIRSTQG